MPQAKNMTNQEMSKEERGQRWGKYVKKVLHEKQISEPMDSGWLFLTKRFIAQYIKERVPNSNISEVTIGQWVDGKVTPSKVSCGEFADAFNRDIFEAYTEAGYPAYYFRGIAGEIDKLYSFIKASSDLSTEKKAKILEAIHHALYGDLKYRNPNLMDLIERIMEQDTPEITKADQITSLIELEYPIKEE